MRTSTSSAWLSNALLAAALLVAIAEPLRADYKEAYRRGLEAVGKKNWAEVARQMRAAMAEQDREGEDIRLYGVRFEKYVPHYYLGTALANTGDCGGALKEWDVSQAQGAIQKASSLFKDLKRQRQDCETRMAQASSQPKPSPSVVVGPAVVTGPSVTSIPTPRPTPTGPDLAAGAQRVQAAEAAIRRADAAARDVAALESDPVLAPIWQQEDTLGPAQRRGRDLLAAARSKLDGGRRASDLALIGDAAEQAGRAFQQLERVRSDAAERRVARLAQAKKDAEKKQAVAMPSPSPSKPPGPPPALVQAARAYFGGNYRDAVQALASIDQFPDRVAVQARLFRAAARHALYLMGGRKDQALRQAAAADVAVCRRLDPKLVPDARAFSPRFREFFRQGG